MDGFNRLVIVYNYGLLFIFLFTNLCDGGGGGSGGRVEDVLSRQWA
jgi:hypothetical protein